MNGNSLNNEEAKKAALEVLLHNMRGEYSGLPRAAAWGYPEPYTRDIMISSLGILVSGNNLLIEALRDTLTALAQNQTSRGHICSLAHSHKNRGASDTTPLFLIGLALFRRYSGEDTFLKEEAESALRWLEYQSPEDYILVAQLPTTDWRDEQWVLGYGLYVNVLVYICLKLYGHDDRAEDLWTYINKPLINDSKNKSQGFLIEDKPYYALYAYKIYRSERFDLLGNSLAILSGLAPETRAGEIIDWLESECDKLKSEGDLGISLPPCLIPYIRVSDSDWQLRYQKYNHPGEYHNGGVWPFICGFYIAALVAAGRYDLAVSKMQALTSLIKPANNHDISFGFNEWLRAQNGKPLGQDWQTWSAAMYLYASAAIEKKDTVFFNEIRGN